MNFELQVAGFRLQLQVSGSPLQFVTCNLRRNINNKALINYIRALKYDESSITILQKALSQL